MEVSEILVWMTIGNKRDLEGIRVAGRVVADALAAMRAAVEPGISTAELDQIGASVAFGAGGQSAPQLVYGFPGVNLISVNDQVVHGIPEARRIEVGDVVKLDVTVELGGYIADVAETVVVPPVSALAARLQRCATASFYKGLGAARVGRPVREIGGAVEREVRDCGFHVLRELSGHGVGRTIHESPTIPNYDSSRANVRLREGAVITIEPLISASPTTAFTDVDGWTIRTRDGSLAAHHEHTLIVWREGPEIVTRVA